MRLLINTLSIGSMSGEHVVYGFLRPLIMHLGPDDHVFILKYENQSLPEDIKTANLTTIVIPDRWRHWALRTTWELLRLSRLIQKESVNLVLNVSGAITPMLPVPQMSLAMNPWCFVKAARSGWLEEIKAFLQRRAYRHAFRKAANMIYISRHLRGLYRQANPDCLAKEADSTIAYVGLNDELFDAAKNTRGLQRMPLSILTVSAFAPWKGVETVIEALNLLRQRSIQATLTLVGPWPDAAYKDRVESLIGKFGLEDVVTIQGKLPVAELHRQYASHQVYCLMSSCESFGIPAAESMAFGTPVVSTNCCAIAEICEGAGLFGPVNDPHWTAQALESILTDQPAWIEFSNQAQRKTAMLTWQQCTQPIIDTLRLSTASA